MFDVQTVSSDRVYSAGANAIFSLTTGQPIWSSAFPAEAGAISNGYVIFASKNRVYLKAY